jgi:hypothetical protein
VPNLNALINSCATGNAAPASENKKFAFFAAACGRFKNIYGVISVERQSVNQNLRLNRSLPIA